MFSPAGAAGFATGAAAAAGAAVAFWNTNNAATKTNTVTYSAIMDSTWQCICADITSLVADNNKVSMTVTNNGTETVTFRIDVGYTEGNQLVSQIKNATNATVNSSENNASFEVEAGATITLVVEFDTTTPVTGMNVFIDSAVWKVEEERVTHSGNITISNISFSK